MKEKKHIDRLYQEKFKNFEVSPQAHVWQNISERIESKKKRRVIPLWYRIAGAAALLALFFTVGNQIWFNTQPQIVDTEEETIFKPENSAQPQNEIIIADIDAKEALEEDIFENEKDFTSEGVATVANTANSGVENTSTAKIAPSERFNGFSFTSEEENFTLEDYKRQQFSISENGSLANNENPVSEEEINPLLELEKQQKEKDEEISIADNGSKIKVRTFAAPIFYNGFGNGHNIDPQFADNRQEGEVTMSYGVNVAYEVSGKVTIRSGVNKVAMSYNTMGVAYGSAIDPVALRNINYSGSAGQLAVFDADNSIPKNTLNTEFGAGKSTINNGYLNQRIGFIELPVEVQFALIDKRFGLNLIGGASTLILDDNRVSINSGSYSTALGENNSLNPVSFSTNIGLGVDYKLTEKFQLNLEPMFKYQLNTFNSGNFRPYYMGVYTGISYKF